MNRNRIMWSSVSPCCWPCSPAWGRTSFLSGQSRVAEQARLQTVGIIVALVDIPWLDDHTNQVAVSAWPKDNYPKDAISDPKIAVGRVALRDFFRGEPVVESKLVL